MSNAKRVRYLCDEITSLVEKDAPVCYTCKEVCDPGQDYRCWDCKLVFCHTHVLHHFGPRYTPHPVTLPTIADNLKALLEQVKKDNNVHRGAAPSPVDDDLAALLWRTTNLIEKIT